MSKKRSKWTLINQSNPFLILFNVHICILAFTFYKKRDKGILVLLLSNIGFAYLFEYFVLNLFNGYRYYPKLLKNKYKDNILGAVFSQALYVPIIATTISAFRLGWRWKLFLSFCYFFIEHLFIYLKKFKTKWWKTHFTFFFLLLFFKTSDIWHRLMKNNNTIAKEITSFLSVYTLNINGLFILSIFNQLKLGIGKISTWKEHFVILPIYSAIVAAVMLFSYKVKWKFSNLIWGVLVLLIDYVLHALKFFKNKRSLHILFPVHILLFYLAQKLLNLIYVEGSEEMKIKDNSWD